jgi:hypothetical protein
MLDRGSDDADRAEAERIWTGIVDGGTDVTSSLRGEALDRLAHAAAARGDLDTARALVARASTLSLDGADRRQLEAESFAFTTGDPLLIGYFFSPAFEPMQWALAAAVAEPDLGFAHYLLGLQRAAVGDSAGATIELVRAIALGLPGRDFVDNAARKLAVAGYRAGSVDGVRAAIAAFETADATTVDRLLGADWQARLDFDNQLSKRAHQ